jgi:hypothetical protein
MDDAFKSASAEPPLTTVFVAAIVVSVRLPVRDRFRSRAVGRHGEVSRSGFGDCCQWGAEAERLELV